MRTPKRNYIVFIFAIIFAFTACDAPSNSRNNKEGETTFTVRFDRNGGKGTAPSAQTVNAGSSITLPDGDGLSKSGYSFGGWNIDEDGMGTNYRAGSVFKPDGDVTLYAVWDANSGSTETFTVTFNTNGGSGTVPAAQTVDEGSRITLPGGDELSKNGYTFDGWNTNKSGTGTNYVAGSLYTVTGNIALYARWVVTYTVTFNSNGGNGAMPAAQTAISGSDIILPDGDGLTKSGYTFDGWNTNTSGVGTNYSPGSSYTVTGNSTLYARWITIPAGSFTVTFYSNGGSSVTTQTVNAGGTAMRPANPTRNDYTFDNWYSDSGLTTVYYFSTPITGYVTLYAKWTLNQYTVSFDSNGGSTVSPITGVNHGSIITKPADPAKSGYIFGGWFKEETLTNQWNFSTDTVTANTILYAQWDQSVPVGIGFSGFSDETVDLSGDRENDIAKYRGDKLVVTVVGQFDSYAWYLNGTTVPAQWVNGNRITLDADLAALPAGDHILTAVVTKGGTPYSKVLTFRVVW